MRIEVDGLCHIFNQHMPFEAEALRDISFVVEQGEFVSIIGQTGCGKSTLVQHINGLLTPSSGNVYIDGVPAAAKTQQARELRRRIGLVFQYPEYQLFEETVLKDVCFGPVNLGFDNAKERAAEAMELVGLDPAVYSEKSPFDLSGGEKRRVAIAGVLAMQPDVLILDEPSAGLDPEGHENILQMIDRVKADKTVIMISHDMDDVARLSGRVLVMSFGRLVMDAPPSEVFKKTQRLAQANLLPPAAKMLASELKEAGIIENDDCITMEQLEKEIRRTGKFE